MSPEAYTLILTQGVHVVRPDVAAAIRAAVEAGDKVIDIDIDLFGGLDSSRRTTVVVAHVVALAEAKPSSRRIAETSDGKVRTIFR